MSAAEELEEHVHHAKEPFDRFVAGTMAMIAALLAIVSVLGTHYNTEKLLSQQLGSDQWSFYQAKNIRRYAAEVARDLLLQVKADPKPLARYEKDIARYQKDMDGIQEKAREYEKDRDIAGRRAERFHAGEVFLEIGIVFSSLAILTKRKSWYLAGTASALVGLVVAVTAFVG
jgi:Domain of unknown function (DUF4337)